MITIIFESHSTTVDNETGQAAGWYDVELSKVGEEQAKELGKRRKNDHFDAIFCSDLQRSYKTAELAFGDKFPIIKDKRLRECNYGDWNREVKTLIEAGKPTRITSPYPNGESWEEAANRVIDALREILEDYQGKTVLIIGHRATQYGIEKFVNGGDIEQIALAPWSYQPGWKYEVKDTQAIA